MISHNMFDMFIIFVYHFDEDSNSYIEHSNIEIE